MLLTAPIYLLFIHTTGMAHFRIVVSHVTRTWNVRHFHLWLNLTTCSSQELTLSDVFFRDLQQLAGGWVWQLVRVTVFVTTEEGASGNLARYQRWEQCQRTTPACTWQQLVLPNSVPPSPHSTSFHPQSSRVSTRELTYQIISILQILKIVEHKQRDSNVNASFARKIFKSSWIKD